MMDSLDIALVLGLNARIHNSNKETVKCCKRLLKHTNRGLRPYINLVRNSNNPLKVAKQTIIEWEL